MNCLTCGKQLPAGAAFCMHCGAPRPAASGMPVPSNSGAGPSLAYPAVNPFDPQGRAQGRRRIAVAAAAGVLALLALTLGLTASGLLRFGASMPAGPALKAEGQLGGATLAVKGAQAPPAIARPGERKVMPPEVLAWLNHLEETERRKVELSGDQIAEVTTWLVKNQALGAGMGLGDPFAQEEDAGDQNPASYSKAQMMDLRPQWQELNVFFAKLPPPAECKPIADDYYRALNELPAMMGDIGAILTGGTADASDALQKLKKLQNKSYDNIDRYFARSDEKVEQICDKYDTAKWFKIKADVMAGGVLGQNLGLK